MEQKKCSWHGISKKEYVYSIFEMPPSFKIGQPGNYIFTKKNSAGQWVPIYIGQTKDLGERFDDHHKVPCIISKGATHIHAHLNKGGENARTNEESDLLQRFTNALTPTGCNEKM
jgi:hypothetical protein